MKKITSFLLLLFVLLAISSSSLSYAFEEYEEAEITFEDAFVYISENIIDKSMNFLGENENWEISLELDETIGETGQVEYSAILTITLKQGDITWTRFDLISNNGIFTKNEWQIFRNPIKITTNELLPVIDEEIVIVTSQRNLENKDVLFLVNNIDEDMISSKQASSIFIEKFYETYGVYPPMSYSYEISAYNGYWLISFDDNDGIGGKGILLIDGTTGYADDIKIDE